MEVCRWSRENLSTLHPRFLDARHSTHHFLGTLDLCRPWASNELPAYGKNTHEYIVKQIRHCVGLLKTRKPTNGHE
ncbi:hypothetical protein Hypma_002558 [Hypsizygus marmoreus]|uniref:Uncharacterized protein n=1 Tax=Hypsizygus marmoreus TaxID=39966 RepID=A0A369JAG5_HYPMA|nr:hypothetical protein Hypma_002558 [Hypsizygus marmoreus]